MYTLLNQNLLRHITNNYMIYRKKDSFLLLKRIELSTRQATDYISLQSHELDPEKSRLEPFTLS